MILMLFLATSTVHAAEYTVIDPQLPLSFEVVLLDSVDDDRRTAFESEIARWIENLTERFPNFYVSQHTCAPPARIFSPDQFSFDQIEGWCADVELDPTMPLLVLWADRRYIMFLRDWNTNHYYLSRDRRAFYFHPYLTGTPRFQVAGALLFANHHAMLHNLVRGEVWVDFAISQQLEQVFVPLVLFPQGDSQ